MALSLVLIFFDCKWQCFVLVRQIVHTVVSPLYFIADIPAALIDSTSESLSGRQKLMKENTQLSKDQLVLSYKVQRLAFLEQENKELKSLLGLSQKINGKYIGAEVMAANADDFGQQVVVDVGKNSGIYVGQPVFDAYGIIGQVVMVDIWLSRVMLITDRKSAIPVIIVRNGMRTLAIGSGIPNVLELAHVPDTADVKVGDMLVTSGIGIKLPAGYAVGVVSKVEHIVGERFAKVTVLPYAHVNSSRYVIMLWPDEVKKTTKGQRVVSKRNYNKSYKKIVIKSEEH